MQVWCNAIVIDNHFKKCFNTHMLESQVMRRVGFEPTKSARTLVYKTSTDTNSIIGA